MPSEPRQPATITLGRCQRFFRLLAELGIERISPSPQTPATGPDLSGLAGRPVRFNEQVAEDVPLTQDEHGHLAFNVPALLIEIIKGDAYTELGQILYDVTEAEAKDLSLDEIETACASFAAASVRPLNALIDFAGTFSR